MNAVEVLEAVATIGGSLSMRGDRLILNAPDKSRINDHLRESIQTSKSELLAMLCPHLPGCPHSDAELIEVFKKTGKLRLEHKSGAVWLVATQQHVAQVNEGTVYVLEEWRLLSDLPDEQIRMVHELRTIGGAGGSLEVQP